MKTKHKLSSQDRENIRLLELAAEHLLCGRRNFACNAIDLAANENLDSVAKSIFRSLYHRDAIKSDPDVEWTSVWWPIGGQEVRIFTLLLAAEVVRTQSLP
jgi:hypothetical protein